MKGKPKKRRNTNVGRGRANSKPSELQRAEESEIMSGRVTDRGRRDYTHAENDPSWYAASPQLLKDVSSYAFGKASGLSMANRHLLGTVPGVLVYNYLPCVGVADSETSAVNVAMRKLYSFVRYANSGARNYDAPDMMMYLVATGSAYMYLSWMERVYGVFMNYQALSRYTPTALLNAMGVDIDDVEHNIADFRAFINLFATKLNQLWVPANFSFINRHMWMASHYYVDSQTSPKAQMYLYNPVGYYKFTVNGDPAVSSLVMVQPWNNLCKVSDIIQFGNSLLAPLITNEDIGLMAGDILKAYGATNCMRATGIDESYKVYPEFVPEVASQFENATVFGNASYASFNVTQDTAIGGGYLKCTPQVSMPPAGASAYAYSNNTIPSAFAETIDHYMHHHIINFHGSDPQPSDIMVATRLTVAVDTFTPLPEDTHTIVGADFNVKACGTEVIIGAYIWYFGKANMSAAPALYNRPVYKMMGVQLGSTANEDRVRCTVWLSILEEFSNFDWHFGVYPFMAWTTTNAYSSSGVTMPMQDLDFSTELVDEDIKNMHDVAVLSEFTVPMIG